MNTCPTQKLKTPSRWPNGLLGWWSSLLTVFLLVLLLIAPPHALAATGINKQINFQGKVVNINGTNVANGDYSFVFSLYTVASGGTNIWTETKTLTVTDGIFRTALGSLTALPGSVDFNTDNIYLGINFNSDGEMTTRVQFTAVPYAFNALKVAGLTVTDTTGTLTIANTKTVSFADAFTTSGANPLTLTTSGSTNVTLPTTGTLLTNTAGAVQTVTSTQSTGTILGVTDSTALTGAIKGAVITLSGSGVQDQTGLEFNLSNATGSNLNDIVGTASTWKVSKAGVLTVASCTGCGGGGATLQTAYAAGNTITTTTGNDIALVLPAGLGTRTKFSLTNSDTTAGSDFYLNSANASGTTTNGQLIEQTGAGTLTNGLNITQTSGALTNGLTFTGTFTKLINSTNFNVSNVGAITAATTTNTINSLIINGSTQTLSANNIADSGALTIKSGGTSALTLDTSGAAALNLGNTNATSLVFGNVTTNPTFAFNGSGLTTLGGGLTFSGTTARTITGPATGGLTVNTTSGPLTLSTTTIGTLAVTSAGILNLTGAAASTWLTSGASSTLIIEAGATTANTALTLRSANQSAGTTNSGGLTILSGNAAGATSTAGNIVLDVGTSTTSNGSILIGTAARTQTITIGNSTGGTITVGQSSGSDLALNDAQWSVTGLGAATFASVTSPTHTGAGAVTVSSGGSSGLTFDSASGDITVAANDGLTFAATTLGNNGSRNVTINSGTGGTTATLLVKLDTSGTVVTTDTTTLNNAVGVALNTTTIGGAVRVAIQGVVTATADNAVTAGDYIGLGTTTAGRAKSLGTTYPSTAGIQVIGRALGTQATPGSTFLLMLNGLDNNVAAGGGGYNLIKDETTSLTARTTLAFLGTAVTCADNAGLTQTECTISGAGGGVSFASGTPDNTVTSNNLIQLQKSGVNKFVVANSGGVTITAGTSDTVKTTTGTTLATDFSITGSTLTNVTSANDLISINDGSVTNTMSTSTVVTSAAAGAGSQTILREDGMYVIIHGNSLATGSRWDGSSATMTSVTVATGAVNPGAGAIALKRPDGRYLIVHANGNTAQLSSLFDPWGITAIAAGPLVCTTTATGVGTNAFLRPDGKYVILCGATTAWGVYDPTANTYTAGAAVATAFNAGAHAIQRDDGTFLVFAGGNVTTHWIYNPYASATGTMTINPIVTTPPTITTGAFSIRRADGKFLVMGGAVNASTIYDPTSTSANSGAGTMTPQTVSAGFGPTAALADGAQSLWRQDGKYLLITGNTTTTNVIDPSKTDNTQFVAGPGLNAAAAAGIHAVLRPDGGYQIIRGGATTTTDIYNTGFVIGGAGSGSQLASYETECITATSLNASSTLRWTNNSEGRMWFQAKTGTGACSGSYKDIKNSGDFINPVAGDNRVQMKVFFQRDMPKFADQEWGLRRGLGQTRYRRTNKDPALYDVSVDNSTSFHRSQFEFGNSSDPSGPVMVNLTNNTDRNLAIALEMGVGYGSTINATNPEFYNGAFGTHTALATSATAGTVVMRRPDGKFMVVAGNTVTANAQLYDPVAQTFTAQAGAGNIPTAGTGLGALAIKRPNGTYLVLVGNATTTTNIYDPLGASGSQFVAGPALTAAAGRGALVIPLPNGRVLILHGNFTSTSSIYDPIQNTMVAGPTPSTVIGGGSMAIPRPNGTYFVVLGIATEACTALNTVTNNFDPYTMTFTATGSPAITTGVGPGAFAFQRSDGQWVIVHGGGTVTTCAGTTRTQIYNPITNQSVVGPVLSGVAQHGAHAIQKPDGTWLVVHGGALTTTSTYLEKSGIYTTGAQNTIGTFIAGPALVTAASAGSISFQRDDGKFVTITGNAGLVVQQYDGGWISNGTYRSEAINIADLDSTSALVWQANADLTNISAEVRTAISKDNLQVATFREIPTSGGLINPSASEVWANVNFNFKRTFPSYGGIYTDTWYNGGSTINFAQRKIIVPTLNEFKITKDVDLINLKTDGLSVFRVNSDGDIYTSSYGSFNTGGADLAENYTSQTHLEKGEVVSIDPQNSHGVMRSKYQYQPDVLGIVSTAPGFVAGSYTKDSYPVALVGRVPVKVSTENGLVRVGDYITTSSVPGHAMKATKAGRVLGKALETIDEATLTVCPTSDFQIPGRRCGTVMVFVNLTDYLGAPVELVMEEKNYESGIMNQGSDTGLVTPDVILANEVRPESDSGVVAIAPPQNDNVSKQQQILAFLRQLKEEQASSSAGYRSEIFTDRVTSQEIIGLEIFADTLHAKKIKADSIEGLEILTDKISSLQGQVAGLSISKDATSSAGLSTSEESKATSEVLRSDSSDGVVKFGHVEFETAQVKLDLTVLGKLTSSGGLIVVGPATFQGETLFEQLVSFVSNVIFHGDVSFLGRPTFNKDTAGFAVIEKDADLVDVAFDKEYETTPIVSTSFAFDEFKKEDGTVDDQSIRRAKLFEQEYSFMVVNRTKKGFTIVLNKKATEDITFSWSALAVKDAKTSLSKKPVPIETPIPTLSPTPQPTVVPSISPSEEASPSAQ